MKLVIFSPIASTSAIGRSTALVVRALMAGGHEAVVVRTEQDPYLTARPHETRAPVVSWMDDGAVLAHLEGADACIYQIGDNYLYHQGGLHWLARRPGIVCLHDFFIGHLFTGWSQGRREQATDILESWYGPCIAGPFFGADSSETFIEFARERCPLTEWVCAMASAVISHSHWGLDRVAAACPGPVRVVPLAYDAPGATTARPAASAVGDAPLRLITVGHANTNKRIAMVIRAIGSSELLRARVAYRLCGHIEPPVEAQLSSLAAEQGVALTISGQADEATLRDAMHQADVVCALRWPSLEAASATAIEGLLYGKLVIVTDTGFYAELPDDCVTKIAPATEVESIRSALEWACREPDARLRKAERGREWAEQTFSPARYADQLVAMARLAASAVPTLGMLHEVAATLRRWGATADMIDSDVIAEPLMLFNMQDGDAAR